MTAKQTRLTAADWLLRRQSAQWNAEDQSGFETWLTEPGNKVAYLRVEDLWLRAERLAVSRQPMRAPKHPARGNIWPILRRTAAGLAIAGLLGALAWQQLRAPLEETYATAIGDHKTIAFQDGTRIELNTDTVLRIAQTDGQRKVWLDKGEAYFEVEHNPARSFVVIANGRRVTDIGTKFAVRQDAQNLKVTVVEGLVEVEAKGEKPQSLLKPGDVLTATPEGQSVSTKPLKTLLASLDWKRGKLFFDNVTLAEAVAEFNRYNSTKLVIADPQVAKLAIKGAFQTRNLDTFTRVTKDIFGLKAEKQNGQIILSR